MEKANEISTVTLDFSTYHDEYPTVILADIHSTSLASSSSNLESLARPSTWVGLIESFVDRAKGLWRLRLVSTRIQRAQWDGVRRRCAEKGIVVTGFE